MTSESDQAALVDLAVPSSGPDSTHISGAYLEINGAAHTCRYPDLPAALAAAPPTAPDAAKE